MTGDSRGDRTTSPSPDPQAGDPVADGGETLLHRLAQEPPIMHDPDPGSVVAGYSDEAVPDDVDDLPESPGLPPSGELGWQVRG